LRRLGVPLSYPLNHLLTASVVPRLEVLAVELHREPLFYRPSNALLSLPLSTWPLPLTTPTGSIDHDPIPSNIPSSVAYLVHDRHDIYCRLVPLTRAPICGSESSITIVDMAVDTPIQQLIQQRHLVIVMAGFLESYHRYGHTCGCQPTYVTWPHDVGDDHHADNDDNDNQGSGSDNENNKNDDEGDDNDNNDDSTGSSASNFPARTRQEYKHRQLLSVSQHMTWMRSDREND
jgi:hypothetical protein